ncbi:MAG: HAD family hydrolase [Magnetococcales bacterium]|nr:HAD family hydrolase [Magnetococcales bacterium]
MAASSISAVAFDFDGVLADSVPIKDQALQQLFDQYGPTIQEKALSAWENSRGVFRDQRIARVFQETTGERLSPADLAYQVNRYQSLVKAKTIACPWIPGAREFFAAAPQHPCYVVSAAPQEEVREVVAARGMTGLFKGVYGGPVKKALTLKAILDQESIPPEKLLFLGDSISDYQAALSSGCGFLGIVAPNRANPFPLELETAPDLTSLQDWL